MLAWVLPRLSQKEAHWSAVGDWSPESDVRRRRCSLSKKQPCTWSFPPAISHLHSACAWTLMTQRLINCLRNWCKTSKEAGNWYISVGPGPQQYVSDNRGRSSDNMGVTFEIEGFTMTRHLASTTRDNGGAYRRSKIEWFWYPIYRHCIPRILIQTQKFQAGTRTVRTCTTVPQNTAVILRTDYTCKFSF